MVRGRGRPKNKVVSLSLRQSNRKDESENSNGENKMETNEEGTKGCSEEYVTFDKP